MELLDELKDKWNNKEELMLYLLTVSARQLELAELIASEEASYSTAFVSEREESIKGTDALARARARSIVGTSKIRYEYEFEALTNLIEIVTLRISQF